MDSPDPLELLEQALADRYRLVRELGAGGMATVYLAHDLRHDRHVALKVLRPELAAVIGAQRFLSEIRTTANLQHPHILPLFDSGVVAGTVFYVMPFVEGESLRDRLLREKQLPVDDALRVAREVAAALDYAHRHGVIHRDIKPENILLHDGRAVVADFGIALAANKAGGSRMTETGMSLGTPQYMSPEQAMGDRDITARSDVFSLGCVLYELLAGEPPFTGATAQAIVARVLTETPRSITAQRPTVPPHVDAAVRQALQKLPADRFQSAAAFADALTGQPGPAAAPPSFQAPATRSRWLTVSPWAVAVVLAIALAAQLARAPSSGTRRTPFRFHVELGAGVVPARVPIVALSTDGQELVYSAWAGGRLLAHVQHLGELASTPIAGSDGAMRPFLSADGRWVAYSRGDKLFKVAVEGGAPVALATSFWGGGSWGRDGRIVYPRSYQEGLWEVSESGGDEAMLTAPDTSNGELGHWWPQVLPDGEHILFTAYRGVGGASTVEVVSRKTKKRTVVLKDAIFGRYVKSGHLLYAKDETLFAVPFDLGSNSVRGGAVPVVEDLAIADGEGYAAYDVAGDGTLAWLPASSYRSELDMVFTERRGLARLALPDPARYDSPRLSPDGTRIAVDLQPRGGASDIWVFPVGSARGTRVTDTPGKDWMPNWTPDGRELVYIHESPFYEQWIRVADASQPARPLLGGQFDRMPGSVSADGSFVLYVANRNGKPELRYMPLRGEPRERVYLSNVLNSSKPAISPDGRWVAYESEETGRVEVYLQSFPDPTLGRWKLSSDGASEPAWSRAGREVVFRQRDTVMALAVDPDHRRIGTPTALFSGPYVFHASWDESRSYDVSKDGETFVMLREPPGRQRRRIVVALDWLRELEARVPR